MSELEPQLQTAAGMGQEPPRVIVGTEMSDDKVSRVLDIIRQMNAPELRELHTGFTSLLNL